MKLELEKLAPYLPYGIKMKYCIENGSIWQLDINNINAVTEYDKPILRPLSDLTKEEYRCLFYGNPLDYKIDELPYKTFTKLLELHFDVFHLIPQGLAIDINTL